MPFAPGTFGSLMAFPIAFIAFFYFQATGYFIIATLIILFTITGTFACNQYMKINHKHDPKEVIIDEIIGQLLTLLMAAPIIGSQPHGGSTGWMMFAACFLLFRLFDITKPWPVSYADQQIHNGFGVMLDDILAGLYAGFSFWLLYYSFLAIY